MKKKEEDDREGIGDDGDCFGMESVEVSELFEYLKSHKPCRSPSRKSSNFNNKN